MYVYIYVWMYADRCTYLELKSIRKGDMEKDDKKYIGYLQALCPWILMMMMMMMMMMMDVCMREWMWGCMHRCMHRCIYVLWMNVCMYVWHCMHVCTHIYVCMHVWTDVSM